MGVLEFVIYLLLFGGLCFVSGYSLGKHAYKNP